MNLSKINTTILRDLLKLSERKEVLLKELGKIETQIISHLKGQPLSEFQTNNQFESKKISHRSNLTHRKRAARGTMKKQILEALAAAGPHGIKIPELSKKIGSKSANIHVWFSSAGKKLPEIERISAGRFRLRQTK